VHVDGWDGGSFPRRGGRRGVGPATDFGRCVAGFGGGECQGPLRWVAARLGEAVGGGDLSILRTRPPLDGLLRGLGEKRKSVPGWGGWGTAEGRVG